MCKKLLATKTEVHALDNLSGSVVKPQSELAGAVFHKVDLKDSKAVAKTLAEISPQTVFHYAADPNASVGADQKRSHLNNSIIATYNVLDAMRSSGAKKFVFASTSNVYGRAQQTPTPESAPFAPISLYAAGKAASESLASSFADNYGFTATILRYANVVGPRSKHGVTYDFYNKLAANPSKLEVLGDGKQEKSYIFIDDVVSATLLAAQKNSLFYNAFNVATDDSVSVLEIARIVSSAMRLQPKITTTGGQAWKGDIARVLLDASKIKKLGWKAKCNSRQAIEKTVEGLL